MQDITQGNVQTKVAHIEGSCATTGREARRAHLRVKSRSFRDQLGRRPDPASATTEPARRRASDNLPDLFTTQRRRLKQRISSRRELPACIIPVSSPRTCSSRGAADDKRAAVEAGTPSAYADARRVSFMMYGIGDGALPSVGADKLMSSPSSQPSSWEALGVNQRAKMRGGGSSGESGDGSGEQKRGHSSSRRTREASSTPTSVAEKGEAASLCGEPRSEELAGKCASRVSAPLAEGGNKVEDDKLTTSTLQERQHAHYQQQQRQDQQERQPLKPIHRGRGGSFVMLESPPAVIPGLANTALGQQQPETTSSNYATRHRQRRGKDAAGEAASLFHIGSDALCAVLSPRSKDLFNAAVASINARRDAALSAATDSTTTKNMKSSMNARRHLAALKDSPAPGHRHQQCLACHTMVDRRESGAMGAHMQDDCPSFRSLVDLKWEAAVP